MEKKDKVNQIKKVDPEQLDDKEMGVNEAYKIRIAASERMKAVDGAYLLTMRLQHNRLSMRANQTMGNLPVAKEFETVINTVKMRLDHALKVVKAIDKDFPGAKAKMIEMYHTEAGDVKSD